MYCLQNNIVEMCDNLDEGLKADSVDDKEPNVNEEIDSLLEEVKLTIDSSLGPLSLYRLLLEGRVVDILRTYPNEFEDRVLPYIVAERISRECNTVLEEVAFYNSNSAIRIRELDDALNRNGNIYQVYDSISILSCSFASFIERTEGVDLSHLRALKLNGGTNVTISIADLMVSTPWLSSIQALYLGRVGLSNNDISTLAEYEFDDLRILDLSDNRLRFDILKDLKRASWITGIESLNLSGSRFFDRLWHITEVNFENLRKLYLGDSIVWTLEDLIKAPWLTGLESLDLSRNSFKMEDAEELAQVEFYSLKDLNLAGNSLDLDKLTDMMRKPWFRYLESLNLSGNEITIEGIRALAQTEFEGLRELGLANVDLDFDGLNELINSPWFRHLESLDLSGNKLGMDSVDALLEVDFDPNLSLDFSFNLQYMRGRGVKDRFERKGIKTKIRRP